LIYPLFYPEKNKKNMGFLKRLFIVEEEGDQKPEQQSPSTQQQQPQQ